MLPDVGALALRASMTYVVLLLLLRLVGKRTVKEATPFDFVVAIVVGDFPDDVIWGEVPMVQGLIAVATVLALHSVVLYATYRSERLDRLIGAAPAVVVRDGAFLPARLRREQIGPDAVRSVVRERGISDLAEVQEVTVEPNGQLSVRRHDWAETADRRDLPALAAMMRRTSREED
jgi:uncharacterized membrane protein YcaP (DUF421 family)